MRFTVPNIKAMKTIQLSLLTLLLVIAGIFNAHAQAGMEDVVYLKNGNIYRGIIIEQVPNVSIKIQTLGGNVFSVQLTDVTKITKENKVDDSNLYNPQYPKAYHDRPAYFKDSTGRRQYQFRKKGYFFQGQILFENLQGGVRIINGYKFGRFGYLGIGIGLDMVFASPISEKANNLGTDRNYSGPYAPIFLYYEGDILKKKITPFYALEAGYAFAAGNGAPGFSDNNTQHGGAIGGIGFGVKFHTRRRVHFSLLANLNFKNVRYDAYTYYYDPYGYQYGQPQSTRATLIFPGIRFGIGF
jgi:hypothetical protein